jgi:DNA mismatch endonuclease (patch repair protein)
MPRLSRTARSAFMAKIRSRDTKPELVVRRMAHSLGYRYRLHRRDLPGTPDLAFISKRKAVFVNGCFWHLHEGCRLAKIPLTRRGYWVPKLLRNRGRDARNIDALHEMGWAVLTVWECQTTELNVLASVLHEFLQR